MTDKQITWLLHALTGVVVIINSYLIYCLV